MSNLPLPSVLLANAQSVRARISYQQDIKNCKILCFTKMWLNVNMNNIQLAGFTLFHQDRTAASGKTRNGGLCIFVNNSWCMKSNEISRFYSPELEYLIIICRPHYLPRAFSSIFFGAVDLPPQTNAEAKTALKELYTAISKKEIAHPEAALLVAGDFNAGKLLSALPNFYQHFKCETRGEKNSRPPVLHTQRCVLSSPQPSIWHI